MLTGTFDIWCKKLVCAQMYACVVFFFMMKALGFVAVSVEFLPVVHGCCAMWVVL